MIVERLAASIYKQGEQKSKAGDSAAAVDDFLRVSTMAPTSKVRANADFDAAALLDHAEAMGSGHRGARGFPPQFPGKPAAGGRHAQARGRLLGVEPARRRRPSNSNESRSRPSETPEVQREATLQAADLYDKAGNTAKSRAMLEAFVKHFPQPLNPAMEARNKLSVIAGKSGDLQRPRLLAQGHHRGGPLGGRRPHRSQPGARREGDADAGGSGARGVQAHQAGGAAQEISGGEAQGDGGGAQGLRARPPITRWPRSRPRRPSRARSCTASSART